MIARHIRVFVVCPALLQLGAAQALPVLQEMALHTMLESTTAVFTTLREYALLNPDGISDGTALTGPGGIAWTGFFGNSGWSYSGSGQFGGMALSMSYSGLLSGSLGGDITLATTGTGSLGSGPNAQPLLMTGQSTWFYDSGREDYVDMDFEQLTKIGANSWRGRVRGREKIRCFYEGVEIGDGAVRNLLPSEPVSLSSVASLGKTAGSVPGLGFVPGTQSIDTVNCKFRPSELFAVASLGKRGSMTVSTTAINLLSNGLQAPLAFPAAPAGDLLVPENVATLISDDGKLYADEARNLYRSDGRIDGSSFSGTTYLVPEPESALLVLLGIIGLVVTSRAHHGGGRAGNSA